MSIYIFTGPTLTPEAARDELDAIYLPPVQQGDVYRVTRRQPQAIGIIDGYFEHVPAVWHKEILFALSQGIHVFGSASMGALRASELAAFGMEGIGKIFTAYARGVFEDDDEVAIIHGPAEAGFRAQSEAMVNIRFTLMHAVKQRIVSTETAGTLVDIAKALFYPVRHYPLIFQQASEQGVAVAELNALRNWLPTGRIDQKQEDALSMLRVMRKRVEHGLEPKHVCFTFQYTDVWEHLTAQIGGLPLETQPDAETVLLDRLLDEVRLQGLDYYTRVRQGAMVRLLALEEARRSGLTTSKESLAETADTFRYAHNLLTTTAVEQWLEAQDLNLGQAGQFLEEEGLLTQVEGTIGLPPLLRALPNYLRKEGTYAHLLQRAQEKRRALAAWGMQTPSLADAGLANEEELFQWYGERVLGQPMEREIERYARQLGYTSKAALVLALLREYCYRTRQA